MISWGQWCSLLAISRHGTFAKAAITLSIDATTLGRRLKALEDQLGYDLFLRDGGRLYPTNQCEELLTHIETADDALRQAMQISATTSTGVLWRELRMTAPPFLVNNLYAPAVAGLTARRNIRVELISTSNSSILTRREADIAIRIQDRPQDFRVEYQRIDATQIGCLRYAVYAAKEQNVEKLPWAGLTERHLATTGSKAMLGLVGSEGITYQAQHFEAIKELAANGPARAFLPDIVAAKDSRLVRVSETLLEQPLWMLYHRQDHDVPHLRAAREWIKALARTKLSEVSH